MRGYTSVSAGSGKSRACTDRWSASLLPSWKSVRPHPPIRMVSPVKTAPIVSSYREMQPLVWPGVARTLSARRPSAHVTTSLSDRWRSALAPEDAEMADWRPGTRCLRRPVPVMWSAWQCVLSASTRRQPALRPRRVALHLLDDWVDDDRLLGRQVIEDVRERRRAAAVGGGAVEELEPPSGRTLRPRAPASADHSSGGPCGPPPLTTAVYPASRSTVAALAARLPERQVRMSGASLSAGSARAAASRRAVPGRGERPPM